MWFLVVSLRMKSYGVTIQMKATYQYVHVLMFIILCKVVLTFESSDEIPSVTIQVKASEQYFPVVLFIKLHKLVLIFESVNGILKCDHSNESYWAVLSCGTVWYAVRAGSNFWDHGLNPKVWPFKWKLQWLSSLLHLNNAIVIERQV